MKYVPFPSVTPVHDAERERIKNKKWIQTFTGRRFWPLDPKPEDVRIEDIAHALALKNRYTGHTRAPYSVAEHCVRVSRVVPPPFALPALLHDAGEAYLPDLAAPIKRQFYAATSAITDVTCTFSMLEGKVLDAIFEGLGLSALRSVAESEEVKKADLIMLATEARDLLNFHPAGELITELPTLEDWHLTEQPLKEMIYPWAWHNAEDMFLARFQELTGGAK